MTTTLSIIALFIIIGTLYVLQDTITEALCGGKSFLPAEMKGYNNGRTFKKRNESVSSPRQIKNNKLLIILIDSASVILLFFILIKTGIYIFRPL